MGGLFAGGHELVEETGDGVAEFAAGDDAVDQAFVAEKFGALEAFGEVLEGGFLDDAGAGEADEGLGFGEDDIAEGGEAGHDAGGGGVGEDGDIGEIFPGMAGEGAAGFGHLHEAEHAFVHAGAAGGADEDDGEVAFGGFFDKAGDFLADDGAHAGGEEFEIHDAEADVAAVEFGLADGDGVFEAGFFLIGFEFGLVGVGAGEFEGVFAGDVGIPFFKGLAVGEHLDAGDAVHGEVVGAGAADEEVFFEVGLTEHFAAGGAFGEESFGDVFFAGAVEAEGSGEEG